MLAPEQEDTPDLFATCPECGTVETSVGVALPLNTAIWNALVTAGNDSLPNNERIALLAFYTILSNATSTPNAQEGYLLGRSYDFLKECYSDGLGKGQLSPATDDAAMDQYAGMVLGIQDGRLAGAAPGAQDDFIFYTTMEKAQTLRAAGRLNEAIAIILAIPEPAGDVQQAYQSQILCYTQTEATVINGTLEWDEVEAAVANCGGHGVTKRLVATLEDGTVQAQSQPSIRPNPATSEITVQGWGDTDCTLWIMDLTGRALAKELRFTGQTTVPIHSLLPGSYLCRIGDDQGRIATEKLMVGQ